MLAKSFIGLLEASATTGVVILALVLLSSLLNRTYAAKWKYWVWLVLAVRLLLPFSLSIPEAPVQIAVPQTQITVPRRPLPESAGPITSQTERQIDITRPSAPGFEPAERTRTIDLSLIAMLLWLAGFLFFLFRQLIAYRLFRKQVMRWSRPPRKAGTLQAIGRLSAELGIGGRIVPLVSDKIASPMLTGFMRPLLLLPGEDYTDMELAFILRHELTHLKRRDIWYKLLLLIVNAVHWFNPLVYLMSREAGRDLELACDDEVTKGASYDERRRYSETILASLSREKCRQTALSTYFYGGAETIKERFRNILSMGKKRRGTAAFCLVLAAVCTAGGVVACRLDDAGDAKPIDNISLQAQNSYSVDEEGNVLISYRNGETTVAAPLILDVGDRQIDEYETGFYISEEKTAIAYGESSNGQQSMKVLLSDDMGKTWNTYTVSQGSGFSPKFIGFWTKNDGFIVAVSGVAMGHQENNIFLTADGGKTWREIGNSNDAYARVVTGACFVSETTGFLSFRYDGYDTVAPVLLRTEDAGKTWLKCDLKIPDAYKNVTSYATALSPVFSGANGVLPVLLRSNALPVDVSDQRISYATSDYGKTWAFAQDGGYQALETDLCVISVPDGWEVKAEQGFLTFLKGGEELGSLQVLNYDPSAPLSQFEGNHAETLRSETLDGYRYPAAKALLRRTQPAAANDSSFADELHLYLMPDGLGFAYDLCFDGAKVDEATAEYIAGSVVIRNDTFDRIPEAAASWAEAVKARDGRAQYELMGSALKARLYKEYASLNWVTGASSPWVKSYQVVRSGKNAVITYEYESSDGFAGQYRQTLSFIEESGALVINSFSEPEFFQLQTEEGYAVIASIPEKSTDISAEKHEGGMYSGLRVSIWGGQTQKSFDWETIDNLAFLPELHYTDYDANGYDELNIILVKGEGTGVLSEEVHALNLDLSEIPVEDPVSALRLRTAMEIAKNEIRVKVDGEAPLVFSADEVDKKLAGRDSWFSRPAFGSVVDYSVEGGILSARIAAQLSPAGFLGEFHLKYRYAAGGLKVDEIIFSGYIDPQ